LVAYLSDIGGKLREITGDQDDDNEKKKPSLPIKNKFAGAADKYRCQEYQSREGGIG